MSDVLSERTPHRGMAAQPGGLPTRLAGFLLENLTWGAALLVLLALSGILIALLQGAWPALSAFGARFFFTGTWDPAADSFGALAPLYGTLVTSMLAMLIATPLAIGIAVFLTELCPPWLRRPLGIAIELLAGIPSIVFGLWGLFVLAPFLQAHLQPPLIAAFGNIPLLSTLFAGPPYGVGMLTASLILAIMILPIMSAVMRDIFETTPTVLKEAAYGVGATTSEVLRHVILPHTRSGLVGAGILGLGRALGETMAVTFVVGNSHTLSASLFAPGTTISAAIANEFSEATGGLYTSSLIALGLLLFLITFIMLALARTFLIKMNAEPYR